MKRSPKSSHAAQGGDGRSRHADVPDVPDAGLALDQQRRNNSEAQLAYFQAVWPDSSEVPTELCVQSLLMCGTEDSVQDAMVRAVRAGNLTLVTIDGADHMASFLGERARQAYHQFLRAGRSRY
jgi:pimeloyl-ACP methyl ester carboxylesterase